MSVICRDDGEQIEEKIGVFICHCGENIAKNVDIDEVVEYVRTLKDVVHAEQYMFMCSKQGTEMIQEAVRDLGLTGTVVASCSHEQHWKTFADAVAEVGLNPNRHTQVNIREFVSWVTEDPEKATEILNERGLALARKKADREVSNGIIEAYVHQGGKIAALVELNCETDFVARTDEFKELAHNMALQIAAMSPQFISPEDIDQDTDIDTEAACLMLQPSIKDPSKTVQDLITETIAKVGENIKVRRFTRFELGY